MADADAVAGGIAPRPRIRYTGLWLNTRGLMRALGSPLDVVGVIRLTASETFAVRNTGMDHVRTLRDQRSWLEHYAAHGIRLESAYIMTAFGCNFEGSIPTDLVISSITTILRLADEFGTPAPRLFLANTVGYATPVSVERKLVFLCDESGIDTGIDLDALIECAHLAETVLAHPLPGKLTRGGSLAALRRSLRDLEMG
jgi:hydroxymethylglutaryl-CoA lyase